MVDSNVPIDCEEVEIEMLLHVYYRYGYDFHHYSRASLDGGWNGRWRKPADTFQQLLGSPVS